jgi:hypothetical protein
MKKDFKSVQKEIDKLMLETSEKNTGKTYYEMYKDEDFKLAVKKIAELTIELEEIREKERKNPKRKTKYNT